MYFRRKKPLLVQAQQRYKRVKQRKNCAKSRINLPKQRFNLTKQRVISDKTKKKKEQAAFDLLLFNLYCFLF